MLCVNFYFQTNTCHDPGKTACKFFMLTQQGELSWLKYAKVRVTYRFSYKIRHNDANKMTPPPTSCHIRHTQNFDKIDSFLKSVLNICMLRDLIVGWGKRVIKEGLVFCIRSLDLGEMLIVGGVGFIKVRVGII